MPKIVHKLREWDFCAAQRPDYFIANSKNTAKRIKKYYGREAEVIYPGISIKSIPSPLHSEVLPLKKEEIKDFYLYV